MSAFRNAISTTIISCGRNETWSHRLLLNTRLAAFLQLTEHDFSIYGFLTKSSV